MDYAKSWVFCCIRQMGKFLHKPNTTACLTDVFHIILYFLANIPLTPDSNFVTRTYMFSN